MWLTLLVSTPLAIPPSSVLPQIFFFFFLSDGMPGPRIYAMTTLWLPRCPFWWASDPVLAKLDGGRSWPGFSEKQFSLQWKKSLREVPFDSTRSLPARDAVV